MLDRTYLLHKIKQAAEEMGIPNRYALYKRRVYLDAYIKQEMQEYWADDLDCPVSLHLILKNVRWAEAEIKKIDKAIAALDNADSITDEMISRAKLYPVELLIEFSHGKALCFNHTEKTPSLSHDRKNNRVRCFGQCCQSWDSIGILMQRDGKNFREAVRSLQ